MIRAIVWCSTYYIIHICSEERESSHFVLQTIQFSRVPFKWRPSWEKLAQANPSRHISTVLGHLPLITPIWRWTYLPWHRKATTWFRRTSRRQSTWLWAGSPSSCPRSRSPSGSPWPWPSCSLSPPCSPRRDRCVSCGQKQTCRSALEFVCPRTSPGSATSRISMSGCWAASSSYSWNWSNSPSSSAC